jgi:hypothetical protein
MEHYHKHSDLLDGIKDRIKDGEYKMLMESLSKIRDIKKEIYVKVRRIRIETVIYTEVDHDENGIETNVTKSFSNMFRHSPCGDDCDCQDCGSKLKTIEFKSELDTDVEYYRVIDNDAPPPESRKANTLKKYEYELLKENKTVHQGHSILVYLEDNE